MEQEDRYYDMSEFDRRKERRWRRFELVKAAFGEVMGSSIPEEDNPELEQAWGSWGKFASRNATFVLAAVEAEEEREANAKP